MYFDQVISLLGYKPLHLQACLKPLAKMYKFTAYSTLLTLEVPSVTKINFLPKKSIHNPVERFKELTEWSLKKNALICKQILSTNFSRKYMKASQENLYVDLGAERVKDHGKQWQPKNNLRSQGHGEPKTNHLIMTHSWQTWRKKIIYSV